ncbi:MAG: formate dehydrogenase subunit gamma [Sulfurospirillum sp.]
MKKLMVFISLALGLFAREFIGKVPLVEKANNVHFSGSRLNSPELLHNILHYQAWGELFVYLQVHWFRVLFFGIALGVIVVFFLHYIVIGPKKFSHEGKGIYVYSVFKRIIHWMAALAFVIIVPTGFMMIFGKELGGGELVLTARYLHSIGTVLFLISAIPMFLMWLIPMLPTFDDVKWLFMLGGYLTKKKVVVPAGQFNAGQKMWFWLAILGGFVMIITGAMMYFQDFNLAILSGLKLDQIDIIRISAIVHNFLGMAIVALFITHMYMSLFAIKGSLGSMIDGHKSEDEVRYMHSSFYKKLKKEGKI